MVPLRPEFEIPPKPFKGKVARDRCWIVVARFGNLA